MNAESFLCRELDIRFIDARALVNEAKLSLNISGYLDKEQQAQVQSEALRIFKCQDENVSYQMKCANWELESMKYPNGSIALSDWQDAASSTGRYSGRDELNSTNHSFASSTGSSLRGKVFGRRL